MLNNNTLNYSNYGFVEQNSVTKCSKGECVEIILYGLLYRAKLGICDNVDKSIGHTDFIVL